SDRSSVVSHRLRSLVCVPFESARGLRGALYLDNRFAEAAFTDEDLPALATFAAHAAVVLENARLHREAARRCEELEAAQSRAGELAQELESQLARKGEELGRVRAELDAKKESRGFAGIVGSSRGMQEVFRLLEKVKDSEVPVFVRGESGTGKELVAR